MILATNPDFETATHWGSPYLRQVEEYAKQLGYPVKELYKDVDVRYNFEQEVKKDNPILIIGIGHGNETTYTGYKYSPLLVKGQNTTAEIAKGRHFVLLSCLIGKSLLPWLVDRGAIAVQGYKEEFIFAIDQNNYPDSYAKPFFDAHYSGDRALFEGKTHQEAYQIVIDTFNKYINDPNVPNMIKPYLKHDRDVRVLYGKKDSRITEQPPQPRPTYEWEAYLEPKTQGEFDIKNIVKDKNTQKPIANADITITTPSGKKYDAKTDNNGIATVTNLTEKGKYTREISHPDYKPYTDEKVFPSSQ